MNDEWWEEQLDAVFNGTVGLYNNAECPHSAWEALYASEDLVAFLRVLLEGEGL